MDETEFDLSILDSQKRFRFPPVLESAYWVDYRNKLVAFARSGLVVTISVYAMFGLVDRWAAPESWPAIWTIRLVVIAFLGLILASSYTRYYHKWVIPLFTAGSLATSLGMVAALGVILPTEVGLNFYFGGFLLVILGTPLLGLPLRHLTAVDLMTSFSFLAAAYFRQNTLMIPVLATPVLINSTILAGATIISLAGGYLVERGYRRDFLQRLIIEKERGKSRKLLLNILPTKIAETLQEKEGTIADHYDEASILFADLVGFTPMSANMTPDEMIELLNLIYSSFDSFADKYGVEKIRTIGDNYMVAAGIPTPRSDHAQVLARLGLDILEYARNLLTQNGGTINFRIGINSGPLVAGIIGKRKFHYDVWGDTVNTASRMESHGVGGKIQVTQNTYNLLRTSSSLSPEEK